MVEWLTHAGVSKKYFYNEMLVGTSEELGWAASCLDIIYLKQGSKGSGLKWNVTLPEVKLLIFVEKSYPLKFQYILR